MSLLSRLLVIVSVFVAGRFVEGTIAGAIDGFIQVLLMSQAGFDQIKVELFDSRRMLRRQLDCTVSISFRIQTNVKPLWRV